MTGRSGTRSSAPIGTLWSTAPSTCIVPLRRSGGKTRGMRSDADTASLTEPREWTTGRRASRSTLSTCSSRGSSSNGRSPRCRRMPAAAWMLGNATLTMVESRNARNAPHPATASTAPARGRRRVPRKCVPGMCARACTRTEKRRSQEHNPHRRTLHCAVSPEPPVAVKRSPGGRATPARPYGTRSAGGEVDLAGRRARRGVPQVLRNSSTTSAGEAQLTVVCSNALSAAGRRAPPWQGENNSAAPGREHTGARHADKDGRVGNGAGLCRRVGPVNC